MWIEKPFILLKKKLHFLKNGMKMWFVLKKKKKKINFVPKLSYSLIKATVMTENHLHYTEKYEKNMNL